MIDFFFSLTFYFGMLIGAIMVHEFGHVIYIQRLYPKRKVTISYYYDSWRKFGLRAGKQRDYDGMTNRQYAMTNLFGVGAGLLFIVFCVYLITPYAYLLIIPYMLGSLKDCIEIFKAFKEGLNE